MTTKHDIGAGFTAQFSGDDLIIRGPKPSDLLHLKAEQVAKLRKIVSETYAA